MGNFSSALAEIVLLGDICMTETKHRKTIFIRTTQASCSTAAAADTVPAASMLQSIYSWWGAAPAPAPSPTPTPNPVPVLPSSTTQGTTAEAGAPFSSSGTKAASPGRAPAPVPESPPESATEDNHPVGSGSSNSVDTTPAPVAAPTPTPGPGSRGPVNKIAERLQQIRIQKQPQVGFNA